MHSSTAATIWLVLAGLLNATHAHAAEPAGQDRRERRAFAARMDRIEPGMSARQARTILGEPDDVRTDRDPGGITTARTRAIWGYGADGHLDFPVLGQVFIDTGDRVQYVYGRGPVSPALGVAEPELRRLLRLVDTAPGLSGHAYDPAPVIRIVNALQPLGKEQALAVVDEYLRVAPRFMCDARQGLFLVLRVLFEVPPDPGHMPPMHVGAPSPPAPDDPALIPRFPLVLEGDIPLLLVSGYTLAGHAQPVEQHVGHFRERGTLRTRPLRPTARPLETLGWLQRSGRWPYGAGDGDRGKTMLANQLLRLVDRVYRLETDWYGYRFANGEDTDRRWRSHVEKLAARDIHWDPDRGHYVFGDGSSLPPPPVQNYTRHIWKPRLPAGHAAIELVVARRHPRYVDMQVAIRGSTKKALDGARLVVRDADDKDQVLATFDLPDLGSTRHKPCARLEGSGDATGGTTIKTLTIELPTGRNVVAVLHQKGRTRRSPIYSP